MTHLTVPLPEPLLSFAKEQATKNGLLSPSDYLVALLAEDRRRIARESLDAQLLAGLDSGPSEPMTAADWDSLKQRVEARDSTAPTQ